MNKKNRNKVCGAITDILLCFFFISLILGGREIISTETGTSIFIALIMLGIINYTIFGDQWTFIIKYWESKEAQKTPTQKFLESLEDDDW